MKAVVPRQSAGLIIAGGVGLMLIATKSMWEQLTLPSSDHCADIKQATLKGYFDARQGAGGKVHHYEGGFEAKMSKKEAGLILGVSAFAQRERVLERYRQLMKINHPDRGGSPYLSYKVNEAKDVLASNTEEGGAAGGGGKGGPGGGKKKPPPPR